MKALRCPIERDEISRRILKTPPKPHKEKGDDTKVAAHRSGQQKDEKRQSPKDGGNVD
jgi:hypothetical protein